MGKKTNLPEIRFQGFMGEWEEKTLIDLTDNDAKWSFIGGPFGSNLKSSDYTELGVRIIQLQNIGDGDFINSYKIYTSEEKANELLSCNIFPGDIILSKMGDPVARACIIPKVDTRFVMCSDGIRLVIDEEAHSKYFVFIVINSNRFRNKAINSSTGSTRKRIGLGILKKLSLNIPGKSEQNKIGTYFKTLDKLITLKQLKLDKLKNLKKTMLEKMFPREGTSLPEIRYQGFSGEWERKRLGEKVNLENGYAFKSKYFQDEPSNTILLTPGNVHIGGGFQKGKGRFYNESGRIPNKFVMKPLEIFVTMTDLTPTAQALGFPACVPNDFNTYLHNQRLGKLTGFKGCLIFLFYLLSTDFYQKQIVQTASGTTVKHSSPQKILDSLNCFPSKPEQTKIGTYFKNLDRLITLQQKEIEKLKQIKSSCLSKMFV